jgi:hypothetical protein
MSNPTVNELPERFFLYIDLLGFSELVIKGGSVQQIHDIIDRLNVHRHHAFTTIAFSDTVLVYNKDNPESLFDVQLKTCFID